jgi:hypothetical protein
LSKFNVRGGAFGPESRPDNINRRGRGETFWLEPALIYPAPSANAAHFATIVALGCVDHCQLQCSALDSPEPRIDGINFTEESTLKHPSGLENPDSLDGDWVTGASELANSRRRRSDDRQTLKSNPN